MKQIYFSLCFLMFTYASFATGEQVWVVINSGSNAYAKNPTDLGPVNPCSIQLFYVDVHLPDGYAIAAKFQWYVNGLLVKTSTNPTDPALPLTIISHTTNVYCIIT